MIGSFGVQLNFGINLINPIKGLIGELIKVLDLIELGINLINPIKGLIGELIKF
jgi:hypothetical protein